MIWNWLTRSTTQHLDAPSPNALASALRNTTRHPAFNAPRALADARERQRPQEGTRHGAGEGEVVVGGGEVFAGGRAEGHAVDHDVVGGLQGEGLFYLCVGGDEEV
jgi:hypothetical protein